MTKKWSFQTRIKYINIDNLGNTEFPVISHALPSFRCSRLPFFREIEKGEKKNNTKIPRTSLPSKSRPFLRAITQTCTIIIGEISHLQGERCPMRFFFFFFCVFFLYRWALSTCVFVWVCVCARACGLEIIRWLRGDRAVKRKSKGLPGLHGTSLSA